MAAIEIERVKPHVGGIVRLRFADLPGPRVTSYDARSRRTVHRSTNTGTETID